MRHRACGREAEAMEERGSVLRISRCLFCYSIRNNTLLYIVSY